MRDICEACLYNIDELCIKPKDQECPKTMPAFKPLGAQQCYGEYNILSRTCFKCGYKPMCEQATDHIEKGLRSLEEKEFGENRT